MSKLEILRKVICVLFVWNLLLTAAFAVNFVTKEEVKPEQPATIVLPKDFPELEPITEEF